MNLRIWNCLQIYVGIAKCFKSTSSDKKDDDYKKLQVGSRKVSEFSDGRIIFSNDLQRYASTASVTIEQANFLENCQYECLQPILKDYAFKLAFSGQRRSEEKGSIKVGEEESCEIGTRESLNALKNSKNSIRV